MSEDFAGNLPDTAIAEAVLFALGRPVTAAELAAALGTDERTAALAVSSLQKSYEKENRGLRIIQVEDAFQLSTSPACFQNLIRVVSAPKKQVLTEAVLETLTIIAYRQPVTRVEIARVRGVNSDHAVNRLIEYGLVEEAGRLEAPGRPMLFVTTDEFLRRFGLSSVKELPGADEEGRQQENGVQNRPAADKADSIET